MQKLIDAEESDLFDVLAHVAFALPPVTREARADHARVHLNSGFPAKQRAFLDFVLQHDVIVGVEELEQEKLTPLLRLKYHAIADAVAELGQPAEIGRVFASFQQHLYSNPAQVGSSPTRDEGFRASRRKGGGDPGFGPPLECGSDGSQGV